MNSKQLFLTLLCLGFASFFTKKAYTQQRPEMYYSDSGDLGSPYAKDPQVIKLKDTYYMYYSLPGKELKAWYIGIATSKDLINWKKVADIRPEASYESKGICAPSVILRDNKVHIFYQTYGNKLNDAICHAVSDDGLKFTRDASNPIFKPTGDWTCGRAIDAEVVKFKDKYFLYFATRDKAYKIQQQGVAYTSLDSDFSKSSWTQATDEPILKPTLSWEKNCIEAASCIIRGKYLYMFYAGGYNNEPQQIGVARSKDGVKWKRISEQPFLKNGEKGSWNESESGHPGIFEDTNGKTYLFYQGNNDQGKSWYLSNIEVQWDKNGPKLMNNPQLK